MKCKICGCTDDNACPGGCYWVEPRLCSACVNKNTHNLNAPDKIYLDHQNNEIQVCLDIETNEYGSFTLLSNFGRARVKNIPMVPSPFRAQDMLDEYAMAKGWKVKK